MQNDTSDTGLRIISSADFDTIHLSQGAHPSIDQGMCVMELASYLAGAPWSDAPECSSAVIANFLRSWNDSLDDEARQMLKPYALLVIGTRGDSDQEMRRVWMARDWFIRTYTPAWLKLTGMEKLVDCARLLEALPEIKDDAALAEAQPHLSAARSAARSAAESAAESAARSAAWSAAESAAESAARSAAWSAARSAAWSAARSAAESAAWSAARSAAESAAWSALQETVQKLQMSALQLVDRMIAVTAPTGGK